MERSSLTIEWPVTKAEPMLERPTDDTCERQFVADLGLMQLA
jgi:hypothetical protein